MIHFPVTLCFILSRQSAIFWTCSTALENKVRAVFVQSPRFNLPELHLTACNRYHHFATAKVAAVKYQCPSFFAHGMTDGISIQYTAEQHVRVIFSGRSVLSSSSPDFSLYISPPPYLPSSFTLDETALCPGSIPGFFLCTFHRLPLLSQLCTFAYAA